MINADKNCTICRVLEGNKTLGYSTEYRTPDHGLLVPHLDETKLGEHHVMFVSRDHDDTNLVGALYRRAQWYSIGEAPLAPEDGRYTTSKGSVIMSDSDTHGHHVVHLFVLSDDMVDTPS